MTTLQHGDSVAREVSGRIAKPIATTTALKAVPPAFRTNGQLCLCEDGNSLWLFDGDSAAGASSSVLVPDAGSGRWILMGVAVGMGGIFVASKSVAFGALTDADQQQTIDFDADLPAGAVYLGGGANVTAIFDNAGDTASLTYDMGVKSGDTDGFIDGASLNAVAKSGQPVGVLAGALVGNIRPSIVIDSSVNLNTLTKGAATFYVLYALAF